jgi:acyl-CoA thioesterase-1
MYEQDESRFASRVPHDLGILSAIFIGVYTTFAFWNVSASAQERTIVALGDSNTSGFGVGSQEAFPALLQDILRSHGQPVRVTNAGVPGDTFGGMLSRLDRSVPAGTNVVIVQGGYNDLVDGVPPSQTVANLKEILARLHARRIKTVLCGFFDPNWDAIGRRLAATYRATFVPGGACYDPGLLGPDQLHMSAAGHEVVAVRLARVVAHLGQQHFWGDTSEPIRHRARRSNITSDTSSP